MSVFDTRKATLAIFMTGLLTSSPFFSGMALAQDATVPTPVPVPVPTSVPVDFTAAPVPTTPVEVLRTALRAAERGDWSYVRATIATTSDTRIRNFLLWCLATADSNPASFDELRQALDQLPFYPSRQNIRIRAEQRLALTTLTPQTKRTFLERKEQGLDHAGPISGEGKLELASVLIALGEREQAKRFLADGWRNHRFDSTSQAALLARFGSELTTEDHDARVDFLLWTDRITQSKPLWPLMSETGRLNARRRVGIAAGDTVTLTGVSLDDRGIQYQRVRNLRQAGRRAEALSLLTQIDSRGLPEPGQDLIWTERRNLLNEAIVTRDWQSAYRIASTHGYQRGERFADGEFISGWVALRFLNQPTIALEHFKRLESGVRTPVSRARAAYWLGRTAEVLNQPDIAQSQYRAAAAFPTVYYGQLAAVKLAETLGQVAQLTLPPEKKATQEDRDRLNSRTMMAIINLLSEAGENQFFRQFALALDDELDTEGEHQALSEYARARDEPALAVRVAKAGLNRGILATEAAYPLMTIPRIVGYGQIEDAYTLAITRQESEFNTRAVSTANARGLMQFLPATAASQARRMGLDHDTSWLISRPTHNVTLGSAHLFDLVNNFYGSYVMAAAAYNAGPGRPRQWVQTYGEFRETDLETAIDWVEKIPFSETRNYVQRVLENIQVYRARLNGGSAPISIADDLRRGKRPPPIFNVTIAAGADQPGGPPPEPSPQTEPTATEPKPAP
ncbi:MAG: transglycosylase SLT domain-containing protein [Hyphomonadaceae bacterium]|jgi:soluble lytic murein transglycosylase